MNSARTGALLGLLVVCGLSRPAPAADAVKGKEIFRACGGCHNVDTDARKMGPSLRSLYGKVLLRNGKRATDENVREVILEGWNGMPSFRYNFRQGELDDLMVYLKTLNARVPVPSDAGDATASGRMFFDSYCARCHAAGSRERFPGGDLRGLFRKETLANGAPVTDVSVTALLQEEHGGAPSMKLWLDDAAKKSLLSFLKSQ